MKAVVAKRETATPTVNVVRVAPMAVAQLRTGGEVSIQPKKIYQPLYDTETIEAGTTGQQRIRFFATTAGKTRAETNMRTNSELPAPQTFACHGFEVTALGLADGTKLLLSDVKQLMAKAFLVYLQGSRGIWWSHLSKLPAPGIYAQTNNVAGMGGHYNLGSPVVEDYHKLGMLFAIPPGYQFGVEIRTPPGYTCTQGLRLRVHMRGLLTRSVR